MPLQACVARRPRSIDPVDRLGHSRKTRRRWKEARSGGVGGKHSLVRRTAGQRGRVAATCAVCVSLFSHLLTAGDLRGDAQAAAGGDRWAEGGARMVHGVCARSRYFVGRLVGVCGLLRRSRSALATFLLLRPLCCHGRRVREGRATWLILPVVIRLSQRLSHACLSINNSIL